MTAVEVLHTLQARDIRLTVDGDQLRYDAPESAITDAVLTLLHQHKAALLTLLQQPLPSAARAPESETPVPDVTTAVPETVDSCPHARIGRCADGTAEAEPRSSLSTQLIPQWPDSPGACYACGTTRRWRSVYGAVICARCHPPADAALVAAWEDEA
jgi:hypothetical protein